MKKSKSIGTLFCLILLFHMGKPLWVTALGVFSCAWRKLQAALFHQPIKSALTDIHFPHGLCGSEQAFSVFVQNGLQGCSVDGFASLILSCLFRNGDALPLSLENILPFQLCHGSKHGQHKFSRGCCGIAWLRKVYQKIKSRQKFTLKIENRLFPE